MTKRHVLLGHVILINTLGRTRDYDSPLGDICDLRITTTCHINNKYCRIKKKKKTVTFFILL